jgi:hypothetical protein
MKVSFAIAPAARLGGDFTLAVASAVVSLSISATGCAHGLEIDFEPLPNQTGSSGKPAGGSTMIGVGSGSSMGGSPIGGSGGRADGQGGGRAATTSTAAAGGNGGSGGSGSGGANGGTGSGGIDSGVGSGGGSATDGGMGSSDGNPSTLDAGAEEAGPPALCSSNPLSPKTSWRATASQSSLGNSTEADTLFNPPAHAIDGIVGERWSTGKPQAGDEWLQIDFGRTVAIDHVTLQTAGNPGDYPRVYAARLSATSMNFAASVLVSGNGQPGDIVMTFPVPAAGRYLLITQTGVATVWWTVAELIATCE